MNSWANGDHEYEPLLRIIAPFSIKRKYKAPKQTDSWQPEIRTVLEDRQHNKQRKNWEDRLLYLQNQRNFMVKILRIFLKLPEKLWVLTLLWFNFNATWKINKHFIFLRVAKWTPPFDLPLLFPAFISGYLHQSNKPKAMIRESPSHHGALFNESLLLCKSFLTLPEVCR